MKHITEFTEAGDKPAKPFIVNGVLITAYKQWAVNLVRREAGGEQIELVAAQAWREVLGYPEDADATKVLEDVNRAVKESRG